MYKMAVLDLDGTLLPRSKRFSEATLGAVRRLHDKGVPVCFCTGRNLVNTLVSAERLGVKHHVATVDGAAIYSLPEKKTVYADTLQLPTMERIARRFDCDDSVLVAVRDDKLLYFARNPKLCEKTIHKSSLKLQRFVFEKYWHIERTEDFSVMLDSLPGAVELSLRHFDMKSLASFRTVLETEDFGEKLFIRDFLERMLLIGTPTANKGSALIELCKIYGVSPDETVAIGDDLNDIPMLEAAGMGVAMGNAVPEVKASANYVTETVTNDGAAPVLEKFFG